MGQRLFTSCHGVNLSAIALRSRLSVYGLLPFCKQKSALVFGYDCTRISDLLMSFYPFTFPITIGPGGLAVVLTFSAHLHRGSLLLVTFEQGAAIAGIFLMCLVITLCYRNLKFMTKRFSASGALAISKICAFFVLCIGVEIAWAGFKALGH
jgi:small neutral amino acid transporter SnatA (MarC family)